MSGCCGPSTCCGPAPDTYEYGRPSSIDGEVDTLFGPVPRVTTSITRHDRFEAIGARLGFRRSGRRVRPGLYAIGEPDERSPVLVTANYTLSFDAVRFALTGRSAWLIALNTHGVNVWCAAGKGTFGTSEVIFRVRECGIEHLTEHRTLVLPQLGAPGVAAHEVREATGFRVVYGPIRASDLPAFLDAEMRATAEMRRVRFGLADRLVLTGVELSALRDRRVLVAAGLLIALAAFGLVTWPPVLVALAAGIFAVVAGGFVVPAALPAIPGRMFAVKGALVGTALAAVFLGVTARWLDPAGMAAVFLGMTAVSSYTAMNFTGSSTFTSPSGVLWEMRRAIPVQLALAAATLVSLAVSAVV
ncbi:MAG: acetyl-CoA synthase subunit gamma [Clostridiales bacterium]|nr:acetyl-CoA synthase subunit gamma [Clostridiales bacterium]